jgi:hypothetical protein
MALGAVEESCGCCAEVERQSSRDKSSEAAWRRRAKVMDEWLGTSSFYARKRAARAA